MPTYLYGNHRHRGPGEEELPEDLLTRMKEIFEDNDPEENEHIHMESIGNMIAELGLAAEDDQKAMEEAFQGMDFEEREEMSFDEFHVVCRRL